jgi:hypothetical protein
LMVGVSMLEVSVEWVNEVLLVCGVNRIEESSKSFTRYSSKSFFMARSESDGLGRGRREANIPETKFNEADESLTVVDPETEPSIMGELAVCAVMLLNRGEGETVELETRLGFEKSDGDSLESELSGEGCGLLSLNNNPLLLLSSNFPPSAVGTGRRRLGSFTAMMLMSLGGVCAGMGTPNS